MESVTFIDMLAPENDEGHEPHSVRAPRFWKESGSVDGDHHARSLDDGVSLVTNLQAEVLGGIRRDRRNDFLAGRRFNGHFRRDGTFLDGDDLTFEAIAVEIRMAVTPLIAFTCECSTATRQLYWF